MSNTEAHRDITPDTNCSFVLFNLSQICESSKTCEIDPVKLKEGDNVEVNKVRALVS